MPYAIHIIHVEETRSAGFPGLASKPVVTVCQWFGLKTTVTVSQFALFSVKVLNSAYMQHEDVMP
jgi:hypothetical protein